VVRVPVPLLAMQHKFFPDNPKSQFSSVSCNFVPVCNKKFWKFSFPDKTCTSVDLEPVFLLGIQYKSRHPLLL
jgi:hypothetical protein